MRRDGLSQLSCTDHIKLPKVKTAAGTVLPQQEGTYYRVFVRERGER
jgi:hypothetical protein